MTQPVAKHGFIVCEKLRKEEEEEEALEQREEGGKKERWCTHNWGMPFCNQLMAQFSPGHAGDLEREQREEWGSLHQQMTPELGESLNGTPSHPASLPLVTHIP